MKNIKTQILVILIASLGSITAFLPKAEVETKPMKTSQFGFIHDELPITAIGKSPIWSKETFLATWAESKKYTLEVAEAMPADSYGSKPYDVDSVRSFAQMLKHLGAINFGINSIFFKDEAPVQPDPDFENQGLSKPEIIGFLNMSFDAVTETISGMSDKELNESREFMFLPQKPVYARHTYLGFMLDHTTHHRAQLLIYLRSQHITPPSYTYFPLG